MSLQYLQKKFLLFWTKTGYIFDLNIHFGLGEGEDFEAVEMIILFIVDSVDKPIELNSLLQCLSQAFINEFFRENC